MTEVFQKILRMSFSASWVILAILGLRLLLRKTPKCGNVLLWGLAALRLLLPFSIESRFSMVPSGWASVDIPGTNSIDHPVSPGASASISSDIHAMTIMSIVWFVGVLFLFSYFLISYCRLLRRNDAAVLLRDNIFLSEMAPVPMVIGIVNPKIYLPFHVDQHDADHIIAHEQAHICRGDHWWKLIGFVTLMLHWFNPLVWVAYLLLCRDVELACDEAVIRGMDNDGRADYAQALVTYGTKRHALTVHPLAFGETGVKERLKAIMDYRKPSRWSAAYIIIPCMVLAMCFLTDPVKAAQPDILPEIGTGETTPPTSAAMDPVYTDQGISEQIEADLERMKQKEAELLAEIEEMNRAYMEEREHQDNG